MQFSFKIMRQKCKSAKSVSSASSIMPVTKFWTLCSKAGKRLSFFHTRYLGGIPRIS